jgi:hypothetical protein
MDNGLETKRKDFVDLTGAACLGSRYDPDSCAMHVSN